MKENSAEQKTQEKKKENDLRVVKTKRAIHKAFLQLLRQKNLNKISVVELAKLAEINKGTFYLHYSDVYALYDEVLLDYITSATAVRPFYTLMLTEPETFVRGFFAASAESGDEEGKYLLKAENIQYFQGLLLILINAITESVYSAGLIERNEENTIKLRFLIGGMYAQAMSTAADAPSEATVRYLAGQIRSSFPECF